MMWMEQAQGGVHLQALFSCISFERIVLLDFIHRLVSQKIEE
jgi:hypothetical protein